MIPTNKKYKQDALRILFSNKKIQDQQWICCNKEYTDKATLGRHLNNDHEKELLDIENDIRQKKQIEIETNKIELDNNNKNNKNKNNGNSLTQRRAKKGTSDPIELNCDCDQSQHRVILFYEYVSIEDPIALATKHKELCGPKRLDMTGKIRISSEGVNITIAGTKESIESYMNWYMDEANNPLFTTTNKEPNDFFKPSIGCRHVFHPDLSVKIVDEICPLSQPTVTLNNLQQEQHQQHKLSPAEFHQQIMQMQMMKKNKKDLDDDDDDDNDDDTILLDTRNYYESKIGNFKGAITPPIRKFSVFPNYINQHKDTFNGKKILTYCTGGIRCEKATAYLRQALDDQQTEIYMLDGGIHQYLNWLEENPDIVPFWQGKNYVFDARQNMGLPSIISQCQECHQPWDTYQKCQSSHCHLLVLHCDTCRQANKLTKKMNMKMKLNNNDKENVDVSDDDDAVTFCCQDCQLNQLQNGHCLCERLRKQQEASSVIVPSLSSSSSSS